MGRTDDARGAVPVCLALHQLERLLYGGLRILGPCVEVWPLSDPSNRLEIDCIGAHSGQGRESSVVIGECKTTGSVSTERLERLAPLIRALAEMGSTPYVLIAKDADGFGEDELAVFRDGAWAEVLILWTRTELEGRHPYEAGGDALPHSLADGPHEAAENSRARYLK